MCPLILNSVRNSHRCVLLEFSKTDVSSYAVHTLTNVLFFNLKIIAQIQLFYPCVTLPEIAKIGVFCGQQ